MCLGRCNSWGFVSTEDVRPHGVMMLSLSRGVHEIGSSVSLLSYHVEIGNEKEDISGGEVDASAMSAFDMGKRGYDYLDDCKIYTLQSLTEGITITFISVVILFGLL
jgi:hypothetical protein